MNNFNKYLKSIKKDNPDASFGRFRTIPCKECGQEVPIDLTQTCQECNGKKYE